MCLCAGPCMYRPLQTGEGQCKLAHACPYVCKRGRNAWACSHDSDASAKGKGGRMKGERTRLWEVMVKNRTMEDTMARASCDQKLIHPKRLSTGQKCQSQHAKAGSTYTYAL